MSEANGAAAEAEDLAAPLYVAWQITNECNLACLHCIEESGPGKAFADELDREQVLSRARPAARPRGALPLVLGRRADAASALLRDGRARLRARRAAQDRDERRTTSTRANCGAPEGARREGGAGEPRRRHRRATFSRMRVRGEFDKALDGIRNLRDAGVPIEINFSPARFNMHEIGAVVDLAHELGAYSFYTGKHHVHRQRGEGLAASRGRPTSSTKRTSRRCARRPTSIAAACASTSTRPACSRSCAIALQHPAALLIVLPNGLVKLINALPFICGDFRRDIARPRSGRISAARGTTRASRGSSTSSRSTPAGRARCTNGSRV